MADEADGLFETLPEGRPTAPPRGGRPRLRRAERGQVELRALSLDDLVPAEHRVRLVWAFAERLDLAPLYGAVAIEAHRDLRKYAHPGPMPEDEVGFRAWLSDYAASSWWLTVIKTDGILSPSTFVAWFSGRTIKQDKFEAIKAQARDWLARLEAAIDRSAEEFEEVRLLIRGKETGPEYAPPRPMGGSMTTRLHDFLRDNAEAIKQDHGLLRNEAYRLWGIRTRFKAGHFDPRVPTTGNGQWPLISEGTWTPPPEYVERVQKEDWDAAQALLNDMIATNWALASHAQPDHGEVYMDEKEWVVRWYLDDVWSEYAMRNVRYRRTWVWHALAKEYREDEAAREIVAIEAGNGMRDVVGERYRVPGPTVDDVLKHYAFTGKWVWMDDWGVEVAIDWE